MNTPIEYVEVAPTAALTRAATEHNAKYADDVQYGSMGLFRTDGTLLLVGRTPIGFVEVEMTLFTLEQLYGRALAISKGDHHAD